MEKPRIYSISFASVYPYYVTKAEKKQRTKEEVDEIIRWLTGYSQKELEKQLKTQIDFVTFFADAIIALCREKMEEIMQTDGIYVDS